MHSTNNNNTGELVQR